jgi:hypothetical protein
MKRERIGVAMFWIGAAYIFVASWLVMWWIAPIFRNTPVAEAEGTIWAFGGPVFVTISLAAPVGIVLLTVGTLLQGESGSSRTWPFILCVVLLAASLMYPSTLGYYPVAFGVSGGVILLFFFAVLWLCAKKRRTLQGTARTAADLQLIGYVFFLVTAMLMCTLLGNPYSGLYFPERVIEQNALPWHYSFGTKVVVYLALAWLFTFLSHYKAAQATS